MKARIKHFDEIQLIDGFNSIPFLPDCMNSNLVHDFEQESMLYDSKEWYTIKLNGGEYTYHISWLEPVDDVVKVDSDSMYCKTNLDMDFVLKTLGRLYDKKNSDYALSGSPYSNFKQAASTAGVSVDEVFRTMIGIKLTRLVSLQNENKPINFESLSDTILDLANYACIYAAYTKSKEMK